MAAGMVPPLAMSAATFLRSRLFTKAEVENGRSAWLLGLSFISEGAIPFAAADPLRVIPATMAGGAITGAMTMAMHVGSRAPTAVCSSPSPSPTSVASFWRSWPGRW